MKHAVHVFFAVVLCVLASPSGVAAQTAESLAQNMTLPVSLLAPSGALATDSNASALSELDGWALTYAHQEGPEDSLDSATRDSLWVAGAAGSHIGLGAGFTAERPIDPGVPNYGSLVFSAAAAVEPWSSFGATWRVRMPRGPGSALHTADLSWTARPSTTLAIMLGGQNLAVGGGELAGIPVERRGVAGVGVRPFGDARWTLELVGAVEEDKDFGFRGQTGFHVPMFGELLVSGEMRDGSNQGQRWLLSAGARMVFGRAALGGTVLSDGGFDDLGWAVWTDMQSPPRPGVPRPGYVAEVKIAGGSRGLPRTLRRMERALFDPDVIGVILEPSDTGLGLAAAQELRLAVLTLQEAGKPVYCYLGAASGPEYYACSAAQRVTLDPAGNIRLMGVAAESLYLGGLLRKAGLRADFVRIGAYKSAPEQFMNQRGSEPAREQRQALVDDAYDRLTHDLAADLGISVEAVRARIDEGPFTTADALQGEWVQATLDRDELGDDAKQLFGDRIRVRQLGPDRRHAHWGPEPRIGVVVVDGTIVDGENVDLPFLDIHMSGGKTISDTLDEMAGNPQIRAIVLRVDSPGGAVMASDQIWRAVRRAAKKKPVVASLGQVAASGGYYVASAADEIWTAPSTITGSIGIFYGKIDAAQLADKLDVGFEQVSRGAHAGAESLFRPFTSEERATLANKLRFWYRQFLERVAEGRGMDVEAVDELARGRVYSGDRALTVGLVDGLGNFASALARARDLADLERRAALVIRPERPSTLLDYILGVRDDVAVRERPLADAAAPWIEGLWLLGQLSGEEPMALWEGPVELR